MIAIRADIQATVDIDPSRFATVALAERVIADAVRDALAEWGNVRTAVGAKLRLATVNVTDVDDGQEHP